MNHLSLFSGIGGIDLAAEWAGMTTVAFVEQNKFCQKVLAKHWPNVPIFDDVRTVSAKDFNEPIDIISGGFPCQPFSIAGKQLGKEDDRALWPEYFRIIRETGFPSWVVGENVIGLERMALDDVLADLEGEGYECRTFDIPACAAGAWHSRRRLFIVANFKGKSREQSRQYGKVEHFPIGNTNGFPWASSWMESTPKVCRINDGISGRVDRLKSLGNAVVPQQIYPIMQAIADIEAMQ